MSTASSTSSSPASISSSKRKQKTIKDYVSLEGTGLFTGCKTEVTLCPAPEDTGVVFVRTDLPGKPKIPAHVDYVSKTPRCTILGNEKVFVQSVEHILSAVKAYDIDNLVIEVGAGEIPVGDGSAMPFVELIEKSGVAVLPTNRKAIYLSQPIFWSNGDVHLVALPSEEFRITYTLSYPHNPLLKAQFYSTVISPEIFKKEIAPCRTFSLYEEIVPLIEQGLIKGGTLENGVLVKGDSVLNPEGLHFEDEMARHKVLDLVGDISLIGMTVYMHIIAVRSGHQSNTALAKEIVNHVKMES